MPCLSHSHASDCQGLFPVFMRMRDLPEYLLCAAVAARTRIPLAPLTADTVVAPSATTVTECDKPLGSSDQACSSQEVRPIPRRRFRLALARTSRARGASAVSWQVRRYAADPGWPASIGFTVVLSSSSMPSQDQAKTRLCGN